MAAGDRTCDQERTGLDPVGLDVEFGAVQTFDTVDDDPVRTGADDPGAHAIQEIREIRDLGLPGGVLEHRLPVREDRRHHEIFRARHRNLVKHQVGAAEPLRLGADIAVFDFDGRAQGAQTGHVQVDRSGADRTAARQRHVGPPESAQ